MATTNASAPGETANPSLLACDIVMAGGVTSGVIYPGAVAKIAEHYTFHSIGGTSAGAIAAAGTAAAEYGRRQRPGGTASFEYLASLTEELGHQAEDGHTRLFHLFTPEPSTRPLLSLITPLFTGKGYRRKIEGLARFTWTQPGVALPVGIWGVIGLCTLAWLFYTGQYLVGLVVLFSSLASMLLSALIAVGVLLLWRWFPAWRKNGYGICTGNAELTMPPRNDGVAKFESLTPWLHRAIQTAAGRKLEEKPVTFGDLWGARLPDGTLPPKDMRSIELVMITSDISRNRAAQLPFLESPTPLYVGLEMLKDYFPESVREWMLADHTKLDSAGRPVPAEIVETHCGVQVVRLPAPEYLPVVFAARLSLSFPVLLSAVPMWTPDYGNKRNGKTVLRKVWYSDGGLTSNFPIHFFDSPIPSRPTFCLNLVDFNGGLKTGQGPETSDAADREASKPIARSQDPSRTAAGREPVSGDPKVGDKVWGLVSMAHRNVMSPAPFTKLDTAAGTGLIAFFVALFNTARYWGDNQMLLAPGTRDRIVHIALRNDEGGLNLDMPARTIADLDYRGRAAGMLIAARFGRVGTADPETGKPIDPAFPNHRWVRYRNFMAAFERLARRFADARIKSHAAAVARGEPTIDEIIADTAPPTPKIGYPPASRPFYAHVTKELEDLGNHIARGSDSFEPPSGQGAAPRPKMRASLRPVVDSDPRA